MGSERGPGSPICFRPGPGGQKMSQGCPGGGGVGWGWLPSRWRANRVPSRISSVSSPGGWRLGFPVVGLWKVNRDSEARP